MPKISVVVPVYKVEKYLKRCVESILNQTYKDFELILVDDGSPDNSPHMCDEYAEKFTSVFVIHQKNGGLSAARNSGIELALEDKGIEWITFIDSDDWVHPEYLELLLNANNEFGTSISISKMNYTSQYVDPDLRCFDDNYILLRPEDIFYDDSYDATAACGKLFQKALIKDIRFPLGKWHEDTFTTYLIYFSVEEVSAINMELYYYYQNPEGIVHSQWNPRKMDLFEAEEIQMDFFKDHHNNEMYRLVLNEYIRSIIYNLKVINNMHQFSYYKNKLRLKLKKAIRENKKVLHLSYKKNFNVLKHAHPIKAKVYRRLMIL